MRVNSTNVYGVFHDGSPTYSHEWENLEVFSDLSDAKQAMRDRAKSNGVWHCDYTYPPEINDDDGRYVGTERKESYVVFPFDTESAYMDYYLSDPRLSSDPVLDGRLVYGPRGGIREAD